MTDGVLLIDKKEGMTSFDVVGRVRRLFGTKQVGHTGTLDPMATGLLVVLVGRAVKASEYLSEHGKRYRAALKLGVETDTEDISGTIINQSDVILSKDEVFNACNSFKGEIMQIPPMYSALKRDGKKLCDLARQGIEIEREARPVNIYSLSAEKTEDESVYNLDVCCSKGTYIRTLCADIGKKLGCGGTMASLRRTEVGGFVLTDAITLDELEKMSIEERFNRLIDVESLFSEYEIIRLPDFFASLCHSGCQIYLKKLGLDLELSKRVRLYDKKGFFSLGEVRDFPDGKAVKPIKKFRLE